MLMPYDFPTRDPQRDIADACNADIRNISKAVHDEVITNISLLSKGFYTGKHYEVETFNKPATHYMALYKLWGGWD